MSLKALATVLEKSRATGGSRLTLIAIADCADDDGLAYPSYGAIARRANLSRSQVVRCVERLAFGLGELEIVEHGGQIAGRNLANVYRITLLAEDPEGWSQDDTTPPEEGGRIDVTPCHTDATPTTKETYKETTSVGATTNVSSTANVEEEKTEEITNCRRGGKTAPALQVFDAWVQKTNPQLRDLTPSRQRLIEKALKEAPIELLIQALDGLVAWQSRKGGDLSLSRVFQTRPGGRPLGEQIEFFASQAGTTPNDDGRTQRLRNAEHALEALKRGWESADPNALRAVEDTIRAKGFSVVFGPTGTPLALREEVSTGEERS